MDLLTFTQRKSTFPKVASLFTVLLSGCTNINYQDRAATPLKPMKTVVRSNPMPSMCPQKCSKERDLNILMKRPIGARKATWLSFAPLESMAGRAISQSS